MCAYIYLSVARQSLFKWTDTKHSEKTRVVLHQQATWVHWIHSYYPPKMLSRVCREKKERKILCVRKEKWGCHRFYKLAEWTEWKKRASPKASDVPSAFGFSCVYALYMHYVQTDISNNARELSKCEFASIKNRSKKHTGNISTCIKRVL